MSDYQAKRGEKFYITTAIAYTSKKPHIGNTYDPVLADAIVRYKRMLGYDCYFVTGTDEHGQKIELMAKEAGKTPQEYVDEVCAEIVDIWRGLNISHDYFIRTTDEPHKRAVQKIFKKLYDQGDIYKGSYEGKYCIPCESFFTSSQLVDGKCPDCGRPVEDAKEEAYFLRLSKYTDRLVEYYESNPDFFMPASRKAEMVNNFIKPGLSDLCVSRTSFKWGIPVDFDPDHVVYVWLDALTNYATAIGYSPDGSTEQYKKYWPANVHVIGKDIMRFHSIYWPIILMALGEPLPKTILGHPWLLVDGDKMSKSLGNVIYADDLVKLFGTDAVRYYLLSEIPFATDGTITYEAFISKYNSDLANTLGNLVNRTIAMSNKYFGGLTTKPKVENLTDLDRDLVDTARASIEKFIGSMDSYRNADTVHSIIALASRCNKYIDETTPWVLAKDEANQTRLNDVVYNLLESIRIIGVLLTPLLPETSEKILDQINAGEDMRTILSIDEFAGVEAYQVGEGAPLFARLDVEKTLVEIEEKLGSPEIVESEKVSERKPENIAFLSEINYDDFMKIDLRAANVVECEPIKRAKKLLKLTLDDGSETPRVVCSGIAQWYKPEELVGKSVIVVANLKPAVLCGVESNGMILAADDGDDVKVIFLDGIAPGSKVR